MIKSRLESVCRALPGATEEILWGNDLVFKVGGKMFFATDASEDPAACFSFKVADERFLELTDLPGVRPAPYLARARWVQIDPRACKLDHDDLEQLVEHSYQLVFAKLSRKLRQSIRH